MPDGEWFQGLPLALTVGALGSMGVILVFFRWRKRRAAPSHAETDGLTPENVDLENVNHGMTANPPVPTIDLALIVERLEQAQLENDQLRGWLRDLENNLESVTLEATMLVNSLRDNELRWEQAEAEQRRTQTELTSSRAALQETVTRTLALEEALEVERSNTAALAVANDELVAQLSRIPQTAPPVDLRDRDWTSRRRRQRRTGPPYRQSRGTLPG